MSNGSSSSRLPFTIASFIAGVLFGLALGAFLAYVVLPANLVLRDAPPSFLRADLTGAKVEYRDLYVARVAQRHALGAQSGAPDPAFTEAQESLGVTSGDASPADALVMVNSALQAATLENQRDGANPDAGRFTLADQNAIKSLADRLTQIQGQPAALPADVQLARRNDLILGIVGLTVLGVILVLALWLINALFGGSKGAVKTTNTTSTTYKTQSAVDNDGATATFVAPASVDELPDVLIDVKSPSPTEPGIVVPASVAAMAGAVAMQPRAASPVAGESLINTFNASYAYGDDGYDEDFQINSSSGDLIGECGASIAERHGIERPSRVTALGIWVFDKNDFQSTKSMLMTPFAFRDPIVYEKLKMQGDPVQARLSIFEVLTSTLRVEVEVRNLAMEPIGQDPDGYFGRVDLQFRVFKRPL
jgi:hypothetical protein